ncbi:MAG TPA: DUF1684 domain-containing protein [Candidatus Limnocylindrales bacterium]|nr:DUF1684 domain-containing protein [Candidatus Limnocylindrales bacterium]
MSDVTTGFEGRGWLADWRRRIAELYAEVRILAASDPATAWEDWREERELLYRTHPQSPVPAAAREGFLAVHWPYDERLRFEVGVEGAPMPAGGFGAPLALPNSGADTLAFDRVGVVRLPLPGGEAALPVFWMRGYAGGLFLPFLDATSGAETYGAGRYVLDTAKGADLGGDPAAGTLVVDLNFAYQPSCAFDPKWACPLAPPDSRVPIRVEAGERLR